MFQKLKSAISIIQEQSKAEKDIAVIADALKLFDYFDVIRFNIDFEEKLRQCARLLKYQSYQQGETIFLEGERGTHFFLIFSGKVSILVNKGLEEMQKEKELLDAIKQAELQIEQGNIPVQEIAKKSQLRAKAELSHKYQYDTHQHLLSLGNRDINLHMNSDNILTIKQICELKHTKTFGELFMITNHIRTATVIATTDVQLAYIEQSHYRYLFKEQIERGIFLVDALKSSFENIPRSKAAELSYHFEYKETFYKSKIYKEGEDADCLYIIQSGQIELRQVGQDKKEQSISILTAGQYFGQEQGIEVGLKRVCSAQSISNDTKVYCLKLQNLQLPQFENFLHAFDRQSRKTQELLSRRKKQLLLSCSQENISLLQEQSRKSLKNQSISQDRKKSIEKVMAIPILTTLTPKSSRANELKIANLRNRNISTARVSPRKQKTPMTNNSKNWNNFFDAMHSMHEEKRNIRLQSQPQLRYQNIQKIIESNMQFKKLQKQLQTQAPAIDLEKNNLGQIAQNMKSKGIAIGAPIIKNGDQNGRNSQRRFKSLESILHTIAANRECLPTNIQNQQANTSSQNENTSYSPENRRFLSPTLLSQLSNNPQLIKVDSSLLQEMQPLTMNQISNAPDSLNEINCVYLSQTNPSLNLLNLGSQQSSCIQSQPIYHNSSIQNITNENIHSMNQHSRQASTSAARLRISNVTTSNTNSQNMRVQTENNVGQKNQFVQSSQNSEIIKYQFPKQNKVISIRGSTDQLPSRRLRLIQSQNANQSQSIISLGSSQQLPQVGGEEDNDSNNNNLRLNQTLVKDQKQANTSINNQSSTLYTQRNSNKLNIHKKSQSIGKPYHSSQGEGASQFIQKIGGSSKTTFRAVENIPDSQKLIKVNKVNEELIQLHQLQNEITSISPIIFQRTQPQSKLHTEYIDSNQQENESPSSQIAREHYARILQDGSEYNYLTSEESPPLQQNRLLQLQPTQMSSQISQFNQGKQSQEPEQPVFYEGHNRQRNRSQESLISQKNASSIISLIDLYKESHNSSGSNTHRNLQKRQELQNKNAQDFITESNDRVKVQSIQRKKRSINTFTDILLNQNKPSQSQPQLSLQLLNMSSHPNSSRIQDMANSTQHNQNTKYLIYGHFVNGTGNQQQNSFQQSTTHINTTTSKFNYLDVKAETESIKQSLQLKKQQRKNQGQSISKRKEIIEKTINKLNNIQGQMNQNIGQSQTVKENETASMDSNVINKLQQLFQKQKPSTTDSPTRSPLKLNAPQTMVSLHNTMNNGEYILNKQEVGRYQNTSVMEQTEGEETTPVCKQIIPIGTKSYSFSNRFTYRQQQNQEERLNTERFGNQIDMIDEKQRSLSKLLKKNVVTESGIPLRVNLQGLTLTCRNHLHTVNNKSKENRNNSNKNQYPHENISSLQNIAADFENTTSTIKTESEQLNKQGVNPLSMVNISSTNQTDTQRGTQNHRKNQISSRIHQQQHHHQQLQLQQIKDLSITKYSIFQNSFNSNNIKNSTLNNVNC